MKDLKQFTIPFVGLKQGKHVFEFEVDNTFFQVFDFEDFNSSSIQIELALEKKTTLMELNFIVKGTVNVNCDISLEPYDQKIEGTMPLVVKFGPEFNDDSDEILILPHEEYQINVGQYIYELVVLSVPSKRIHPKVADGSLETEALKKLKELEIQKENSSQEEDKIDPRWDKLKSLLTEKNT